MKKLCFALSMALAFTSLPLGTGTVAQAAPSQNTETGLYENGLAQKVEDGTILHCWCWNFEEITDKIPEIAAAGFSSIQTSPICEVYVGENGGLEIVGQGKWYYHYQPTDYVIGNYQLGTEEEFIAMCNKAHEYGIKVIVDSVLNHTTATYSAISDNIKNIEGGAFHRMGDERASDENWSETDRYEETQYDLSGLYELNTQNKNVQNYILTFLKKCVTDGADGFRYDAAKLIELPDDDAHSSHDISFQSDFWPTILQNGSSFQYGEVLQEGGNHLYRNNGYYNKTTQAKSSDTEYEPYDDSDSSRLGAYQSQTYTYNDETHYMNTTNSFTGFRVRDAVANKNVQADFVDNFLLPQGASEDRVVTWVESHDNYCNDASYRELDIQGVIQAWAIITARKGGTPLFFDRPNHSTASNPWGDNQIGPEGSDMYKDPQVVAVNFFRNEMGNTPERIFNPDGNNEVVLIERGDSNKGTVIVNVSDEDVTINEATNMADGTYTDQVYGGTFTVADGKLSGTVKAGRVAVVYNPAISADSKVIFKANVDLSVPSGYFLTDTLDVNVSVRGCDRATYTIEGDGIETTTESCKAGDVITIRLLEEDQQATVTLKGYDSTENEIASKSATYTRKVAKGTTIAYFSKLAQPSWSDVYVYIYNNNGGNNGGWPGDKAENIGNNIYKYVLPYELESVTGNKIIFNSGSGSQLNDLDISPESSKLYTASGEWIDYKEGDRILNLSKGTGKFQNSLEVSFSIIGYESATYKLGDSEEVECEDGDTITIGAGMQDGDEITLILKGTKADGELDEKSATYTMQAYKGDTTVYFDPEAFPAWKTVNAYVWDAKGINNAGWPGKAMTKLDNGLFAYTLPYELESNNATVIFNNGSGGDGNQIGDFTITPGQTKVLTASKNWKDYVEGEPVVDVAITPGTGDFWEDSLDVTLYATGCDQASYRLGDEDSVSFNGINHITVGEGMSDGQSITVTLQGVVSGNTVSENKIYADEATYTKRVYNKDTIVYLPEVLTEGWSKVYVYAYSGGTNNGWPGVEMTLKDGLYSYVLPYELERQNSTLIFNDNGSNRYELGNVVNSGTKMILDKTLTWRAYTEADSDQTASEKSTVIAFNTKAVEDWDAVYVYAYYSGNDKLKNAEWPGVQLQAVDGAYIYELPGKLKSLEGVNVIINNGKEEGAGRESFTVDGITPGMQSIVDENGNVDVTEVGAEVPQPEEEEEPQVTPGQEEEEEPQAPQTPTSVDISKATVTLAQSTYTYDGKAKTPSVTVSVGGKTVAAADYTVAYANNTNAGTATVTVTAKGSSYTGKVTKNFTIDKADKKITAKTSVEKAYGAKAFSLGAKVTGNEKLTYTTSDSKVVAVNANGKVTIKGTGKATITINSAESANYKAASAKVTVKVAPKKVTLSSVKNTKKGQITVKWKKDAKATGYIITYSTKKNFKGAKTVTVKSNKTTSKSIKVKKGQKYYVKVSAYKTIDKKKVQGTASKTKTVSVRK